MAKRIESVVEKGMNVVCCLLGNSPVSELYMPTFRNILLYLHNYPPMNMELTVFRNVGI